MRDHHLYDEKDWEGLKKLLKREFRAYDERQKRETYAFLQALTSQTRTEKDDIETYIRVFKTTASALEKKGELAIA